MHRFDHDSGQVYTEEIVTAPSELRPKRRAKLAVRPKYVSPPEGGAQNLYDIAMRKILCNLDSLDEECLRATPLPIMQTIWKAIRRHHLDTLQIWKRFAGTGTQDRTFIHKWALKVEPAAFGEALAKATSPTYAWLTNLTVYNIVVHPAAMAELPQLVNLRILSVAGVSKYSEIITDSIFRSWSIAVAERGAFNRLQMIFLSGQREVTTWSLEHVTNFSALDTFCVHNCGFGSPKSVSGPADKLGWYCNLKRGRWAAFCDSQRHGPQVNWPNQVADYAVHRRGTAPRTIDNSPVLDTWLSGQQSRTEHADLHLMSMTTKSLLNCFERDVPRKRGRFESRSNKPKRLLLSSPPSKKPKIRHEKTVALNDLIARM